MAKSYGSFKMDSGSPSGIEKVKSGEVLGQRYNDKGDRQREKKLQKSFKIVPLVLGTITRQLRRISGLNKPFYLVGGAVTEGTTLRDLDFVVNDTKDITKIKNVLGKYAGRAHFIMQDKAPKAATYIKFTGKIPQPENKPARILNEYAN